jgi:phosphoglycerate dehydrogenase-like enzyme
MKTTLAPHGATTSRRPPAHAPATDGGRTRPKAAIIVRPQHRDLVYPLEELARAAEVADIINPTGPVPEAAWPAVEVILGGWGMPVLDRDFLAGAPALRAVFYGAGSVRGFMTEAAWERGLVVTTAAQANSETTAEFCLSLVIFSLKHGWHFIRDPRAAWSELSARNNVPGLYGSRIGLVSFGRVARRLAVLLRQLPVEVVCWDPVQPREELQRYGVTPCSLEEIFATSHVVSLHTPLLPETEDFIGARLLGTLQSGATLVNTSRGAVVDERALIEILRAREDLTAVLDVTRDEPPAGDSPLFSLPNVVMTPHIAGCNGPECRRLGSSSVDELMRYVQGKPLQHAITREAAALMA